MKAIRHIKPSLQAYCEGGCDFVISDFFISII